MHSTNQYQNDECHVVYLVKGESGKPGLIKAKLKFPKKMPIQTWDKGLKLMEARGYRIVTLREYREYTFSKYNERLYEVDDSRKHVSVTREQPLS